MGKEIKYGAICTAINIPLFPLKKHNYASLHTNHHPILYEHLVHFIEKM